MNLTNAILLQPTDVLFFRDGRPMEGALAGHGAAWPMPNVTDAAFHAALHRSGLGGHRHDQRNGDSRTVQDGRQFGSLVTAGPFPVRRAFGAATWFFPRPLDLLDATLVPALRPVAGVDSAHSSLPDPLEYAVANRLAPSKDNGAKAWISAAAYGRYLQGGQACVDSAETCDDRSFSDAEAAIGIAIDPATGTTGQGAASGRIYSARYLRLRDDWCLGTLARTEEKDDSGGRRDLIRDLVSKDGHLLVGGQQRLCTATLQSPGALPLPLGKLDGFHQTEERFLVKWVLLSPAIWPKIEPKLMDGRPAVPPHSGGWLPNWVREHDGQVMLRSGERRRRAYQGKHTRGFGADAKEINARLVAAIVPKPMVVTGWALANHVDRRDGGAKSTHLAVPAGAVYYFEAGSAEDAARLAGALNWHGNETSPTSIRNRRSTLMGEKGFGLGVCGTWRFYGEE